MSPRSCQMKCKQTVGILLLLMCSLSQYAHGARLGPRFSPRLLVDDRYQLDTNIGEERKSSAHDHLASRKRTQDGIEEIGDVDGVLDVGASRRLKFLVPTPALILPYHNGPLLSAASGIPVYIIWYGTFSAAQKSIVTDFFDSFTSSQASPSVSSWWKTTSGYKDSSGNAVSSSVVLSGQTSVSYTKGTALTEDDVQALVVDSLTTFPSNSDALYLVLTASDVMPSDFCMNSCGSHFATLPSGATSNKQLPYAWVGNPGGSDECSGLCAWPYAKAAYGPPGDPLLPPNGDVGMEGMVINIGIILAGAATDPFTNGYYQGDASAPLESGSACAGIYGAGAYSGYPGQLAVDPVTQASYNVNGSNGRKFLMSALWDPSALACIAPS